MSTQYKRLPRHWRYPVSRKQIRDLVADRPLDIRQIEFDGTSGRPSNVTSELYHAGCLESRSTDGHWCFRFCLQGLPTKILDLAAADPAEAILAQTDEFLATHGDHANATSTPRECIFFFRLREGVLEPTFSIKKVDAFSEKFAQMNPWW